MWEEGNYRLPNATLSPQQNDFCIEMGSGEIPLMFSVVVEDTVTKTVSISHNTLYDSAALGRGAFGSHYNKTDASVRCT